jgi:hypothetical protein
LILLLFLAMEPAAGCAKIAPSEEAPILSIACRNDVNDGLDFLNWELLVTAEPIESGKPFEATLDGTAFIDEYYLDLAQTVFPGGVREANLVDLNATVHVRSGTTGDDDVVLKPEPIPYECFFGRNTCDPANDLLDDPPDPPGLRGNTDCEPVSDTNPCGRFILVPISIDCDPGGVCDRLGKWGPDSQCELNKFCVTGGVPVPLEEATAQYTANVRGDVLFGWDDTHTTTREAGPNEGTWIVPTVPYEEPTGPVGFRVTVAGLPGAVECTMGVDCKGPLGVDVDCLNSLPSPTPDSALISFPIQTSP